MRRRTVAAVIMVTLATTGIACGGDDDDGDGGAAASTVTIASATTSPTSDATTATWPVTVEHAFGTTTVESRPQAIATLGMQWTDVVLAMGEQPTAHVADPNAGDGDIYPWQAGRLDDSTGLAMTSADDIPFERLAALRPDLILVSYLADDQAVYDRLSAIAPTIGMLGERQVDTWQDMITVAGRFLGDPQRAADVIADVDSLMSETAAEYPGLAGKTFALANFLPGDQLYVVADPDDGSSVFFQRLGMTIDPDVLAAADGVSGRAELSLEQAGLLDGDLLVIFSNGADPSDLVGYDQLAVVRDGAAAELDYAAVVGLNTPTPLSIPFSLEAVRAQLAAAGATS